MFRSCPGTDGHVGTQKRDCNLYTCVTRERACTWASTPLSHTGVGHKTPDSCVPTCPNRQIVSVEGHSGVLPYVPSYVPWLKNMKGGG